MNYVRTVLKPTANLPTNGNRRICFGWRCNLPEWVPATHSTNDGFFIHYISCVWFSGVCVDCGRTQRTKAWLRRPNTCLVIAFVDIEGKSIFQGWQASHYLLCWMLSNNIVVTHVPSSRNPTLHLEFFSDWKTLCRSCNLDMCGYRILEDIAFWNHLVGCCYYG